MNIKEMHYEFKKGLNKIDSQQNRNLLIPEIDVALNQAINLFIDLVAFPRESISLGVERNLRNIEDLRAIIVSDDCSITILNIDNFPVLVFPDNYRYFLNCNLTIEKDNCVGTSRLSIREHDDDFEKSIFDCANFEWRATNGLFTKDGIKVYTGGANIIKACLSYIENHPYVHNAEDFRSGTYNRLNGDILTGTQNCILPETTHREIVDLAVLIASGELQISDYQIKFNKVNFNRLMQ